MAKNIFGKGWGPAVFDFAIKGCKVTPSALPSMDFTIYSASDSVYSVPFWEVNDGLSPTLCFVESYIVEYIESEDGSTTVFTDWS